VPLGDGKGPPDGSGPMTGRRRFWEKCPGVDQKSAAGSSSSAGTMIKVIGGIALLVAALVAQLFASRSDTD